MVVFSRLLPIAASAFGFQAMMAAIFVPLQTEKYFDFCGALGFLTTTFVSLRYPSLRSQRPLPAFSEFGTRQLLLNAAIAIWSTRLGIFLAARAIKAGGDSRFEEVKKQPLRFATFWLVQGAWVFIVGLPIYLSNTLPIRLHPRLTTLDFAALALASVSFGVEVLADYQKSAWRNEKDAKEHNEKFINRGLWSWSRHPNYVGEVSFWIGLWTLSLRSLRVPTFAAYTPLVALASPLMTYLLVRRVSGVPQLEAAAEKKFGDDPAWQEYKSTVPVFFPWNR